MSAPPVRTRFRTCDGDYAHWTEWRRAPGCLVDWLRIRLGGRRPALPWIPYPAIAALDRLIPRGASALEIGAGSSTAWLARRCRSLVSFEADAAWYAETRAELARLGFGHVRIEHRWVAAEMADFSSMADGSLDLVFVDGGPRLACARAALPKLKRGGLLYIDNTDDGAHEESTKRFLRATAAETGGRLTFFRGLPPAALYVNEGALLVLP